MAWKFQSSKKICFSFKFIRGGGGGTWEEDWKKKKNSSLFFFLHVDKFFTWLSLEPVIFIVIIFLVLFLRIIFVFIVITIIFMIIPKIFIILVVFLLKILIVLMKLLSSINILEIWIITDNFSNFFFYHINLFFLHFLIWLRSNHLIFLIWQFRFTWFRNIQLKNHQQIVSSKSHIAIGIKKRINVLSCYLRSGFQDLPCDCADINFLIRSKRLSLSPTWWRTDMLKILFHEINIWD